MKLKRKLVKLGNVADRIIRRLTIYFFFLISSTALFSVLEHHTQNLKFHSLGLIVLSPLAILISFSGLMYNRARAIDSPSQRFRSLYSAERTLSACVLYLAALILGFSITVLLQPYSSVESPAAKSTFIIYYFAPIMLCLWSFLEFSNALLVASKNRLPKHYSITARRVRRLQK